MIDCIPVQRDASVGRKSQRFIEKKRAAEIDARLIFQRDRHAPLLPIPQVIRINFLGQQAPVHAPVRQQRGLSPKGDQRKGLLRQLRRTACLLHGPVRGRQEGRKLRKAEAVHIMKADAALSLEADHIADGQAMAGEIAWRVEVEPLVQRFEQRFPRQIGT